MATDPVVLLLPGMTLNETVFPSLPFPTIPVTFTSLVLAPDGISDDLRTRRMGVYADLLDRALEGNTTWATASYRIMVGHSFGGMLALAWWLRHHGRPPARVDGMVLVSTSAGPMFDVVRLRLGALGAWELRMSVAPLIRMWNSALVTRSMKRWFSRGALDASPVDFRALDTTTDWSLDFAGWRNTDWRSMRSYRQALMGFDVRGRLGEINVPAIVLHGDADTLLPASAARDLAGGLPRAELHIVPGAGHALPLTHGEVVADAVRGLARVTRR